MSETPLGTDAGLSDVMSTMRAMRKLRPDPVPRELIEQLITAATYAPSGGNNQTFSFVVITDRHVIASLAPLWRRIVDWYIATQTPPPHMDPDAWQRLTNTLQYQGEHFEDTPVLIIACYELRSTLARMFRTLDRQLAGFRALGLRHSLTAARNASRAVAIGEAASVYPAVQNILLTARALGLGATLTTWHIAFEQELKTLLGIPAHINTYAIIPIGWPRGRFGPVTRRPATDLIHWQQW
jgi:nitroreductase